MFLLTIVFYFIHCPYLCHMFHTTHGTHLTNIYFSRFELSSWTYWMNRAEFIFVKQIRIHIVQIYKNNVKKQDVKMFECHKYLTTRPRRCTCGICWITKIASKCFISTMFCFIIRIYHSLTHAARCTSGICCSTMNY